MNRTKIDDSYIAGFFDGEGSGLILTIRRKLKVGIVYRFRPVIKIAQKHEGILEWIRDHLGFGTVTPSNRGDGVWNYICNGHENVKKFIERIFPHVSLKWEQLTLLEKFINTKERISPGNRPYTKIETVMLIDLRDRLHELNKRKDAKLKYSKVRILAESSFPDLEEWHDHRMRGLRNFWREKH